MTDLADNLPIYTVAYEWAKETKDVTCFVWLHRMARGIYSDPPTLKLRPDDSWGQWEQRSHTASPAEMIAITQAAEALENWRL